MSNIIIGKHTLESLTTGMYSDPYVVYREYIQNATDAIDNAVCQNILTMDNAEIFIRLAPADRSIVISDNGTGIYADYVEQALISIGNSKKTSETNRGFRGIGRLAALGYCSELTFETSAKGEFIGTKVVIDSSKLSKLLSAKDEKDVTITDVLGQVYHINHYPETDSTHYFRVILKGVDESSGLNNFEKVKEYISQNAPVPYDTALFTWGKELTRRLNAEGINIKAYNISLSFGTEIISLHKPYKDRFLVDKGKNLYDSIKDISLIKVQQNDGNLLAIIWLGKTNYLGSIYDRSIKGIRLRKGNIQIGDGQTLNSIFKDSRFNGWLIGEVFVTSAQLIPNARRDHFEKNTIYFVLMEQLHNIAAEVTHDIRTASLNRNKRLSDALEKAKPPLQHATEAFESGADIINKSRIAQELVIAQKNISESVVDDETGAYYKEIAFDELDMLIGKIKGITSFRAINTLNNLTNTEKKILEKVFIAIVDFDSSIASNMIEHILMAFAEEKRNGYEK